MKIQRLTVESTLFIVALILGAVVRLLNLGAAPLSDFEAQWALRALSVSRGEEVALGTQPGYVLLTGLTFFIFGNANALARLWPAIAGSLLVGAPYFFRRTLGSKATLVLAFGLALDPGLVAFSRLVGGSMIAVGFGLAAVAMGYVRRPVFAGMFAGLAILGGPPFLHGILGIVMMFAIGWLLSKFGLLKKVKLEARVGYTRRFQRGALAAVGATVLFLGTLFFRYPHGLGALAEGIPRYLDGWLNNSQYPASRTIAAMVVYQPLALIFGTVAVVRAWLGNMGLLRWLSLWFLSALSLTLIYPSRQASDLAWTLLPLWILAGLEVARHLKIEAERLAVSGQAILVIVLLVLAWINLAGLDSSGFDPQIYRLRWAVIGGVLALIAITTGLVALGWSSAVAQRGLTWGLIFTLGVYMMANLWSVSQWQANRGQELLVPAPETQQADLLMDTLGDLAEFRTGRRDTLDMVVTVDRPSVRWVLRNWRQVRFYDAVPIGELPSAVISPGEDISPRFSVSYRGQDFAWSVHPDWQGALPHNWPSWLAFREAPEIIDPIILWVRGDVFPGGTLVEVGESDQTSIEESPSEEDEFDALVE